MDAEQQQPLMTPSERQPLVGKQTTWSRRAAAAGALFGASLMVGAAVAGRRAAPAPAPALHAGAPALHAEFNTKTKAFARVDAPAAESTYDRKRRDLEAGIVQAFREVHGREVTSGELEALVHEGVVEHHPELVKANPALETMATACVSFDGDFVCTEELSASPEAYLWLGIDMDSDAGFCYTLFWGVDVDFSFEITTGLCIAGLGDYGSYEFAKEATIAYSGVMAGLLQIGVAAEVTSFDLEASIRMKAERDRAAVDAALARLTADGHDAAKFAAAADKAFAKEHGRAITEAERYDAYRAFAAKLNAARAQKEAKPDFFWGDDVIGLWDDGGSWFWDDWEISIDDWFDTTLKCEQYPYCGAPPGQDPEDYCPNGLAKVEVRIPVIAQVDAYGSGELSVGTPTLESGFGAIDIEFSANAGVTAEAIEVMAAGVEGKISTECDTSSCSYPDMEICAFAELKFPDFELPSWDICGNEIGFDFDLPSVGGEWCWDV